MPVTLPLDVYEALEKGLGKENAKIVVKSIEATISEISEYKWKVTKDELLDAIRKEFVTKELFEEKINTLRFELLRKIEGIEGRLEKDKIELLGKIEGVREELLGKIEGVRDELLGKIENVKVTLDRKFTIMFLILFFTIIFLNQNALEFIAKILGLIK